MSETQNPPPPRPLLETLERWGALIAMLAGTAISLTPAEPAGPTNETCRDQNAPITIVVDVSRTD